MPDLLSGTLQPTSETPGFEEYAVSGPQAIETALSHPASNCPGVDAHVLGGFDDG